MTVRLSLADLERLVGQALAGAGLGADHVPIVAGVIAAAERDGVRSHGLLRLSGYLNTLATGWADGAAKPAVVSKAPGMVVVDARNGFAQVALALGRATIVERARRNGIAALLIRDSHHFAALWPDLEPFCAEGFIAFTCVNSKKRMAVWGGTRRVLGTNAMAFGCPRPGHLPLIWDQASSVMSQGDMLLAEAAGREVEPGVGLDADGEPTRSPSDILADGALLPFGGHKGSALAVMVEVLAAALTGSLLSAEDRSGEVSGITTSRGGQFLMLIDPAHAGGAHFAERITLLIGCLQEAGSARLPGDKRYERRRRSLADGIEVSLADYDALQRSASAGVAPRTAG